MTVFANQIDIQYSAVEAVGDRRLHINDNQFAYFSSVPINKDQPGIRHAIIVVHGALRNAADYFRAIINADPGDHSHRLVIAPQFLTEVDTRDHPERSTLMHWAMEDWKSGYGDISSFAVVDHLLEILGETFSGLEIVTIVGNSAGGQFVNRYAAVSKRRERAGYSVRFVVANPSTYLYFDKERPDCNGAFSYQEDPSLDRWRYGFDGDLPAYVDGKAERYFRGYLEQNVTYLLGTEDSDPGAVLLEVHPAAQAQGRSRRERGEFYHAYLQHKAGGPIQNHKLVHVQGVGHDAATIFASRQAQTHLFA